MAGWSGFTDVELKKLQEENLPASKHTKSKRKSSKKPAAIVPVANDPVASDPVAVGSLPVESVALPRMEIPSWSGKVKEEEHNSPAETLNEGEKVEKKEDDLVENTDDLNEEVIGVRSGKDVVELEIDKMVQLQTQQKIMEEQNKIKKKLISAALEERFKQTVNESQRLKQVQKELNRIEEKLHVDVQKLRDEIEDASILYAYAQKRYQKSEVEYVDAKCEYFKAKERKEELVETLYDVIQANEVRKAQKLEELMVKLCPGAVTEKDVQK